MAWFGLAISLWDADANEGTAGSVFSGDESWCLYPYKASDISRIVALILRLQVIPGLLLSFALAAPWYLMLNAETKGVFFKSSS